MRKQANNFKPQAFYCVSQYGGYLLQIDDTNMMARVKPDFNSPQDANSRPRWQTIKEDKQGILFVTYYGQRLNLDNFMIINH